MVRSRAETGDVFLIPLDGDRACVGQVVAKHGEADLYLAVFDSVVSAVDGELDLDEAVGLPLLFLMLSLDAKFRAGDWKIVGRARVRDDLPLPAYKLVDRIPSNIIVVDCSGTRERPATPGEAASLANRKVIAPVRLEKAVRAHYGLQPWLDVYDELRPDRRNTTQRLFGPS